MAETTSRIKPDSLSEGSSLPLVPGVASLKSESPQYLDGLVRVCRVIRWNSCGLKNKRTRRELSFTHNHRPFCPFPRPTEMISGANDLCSSQFLWISHKTPPSSSYTTYYSSSTTNYTAPLDWIGERPPSA